MEKYNLKNNEAIVIPVANLVLLTGMTYTLKINRLTKEELEILSTEDNNAIALPLRQNFNRDDMKEEDLHNVGVLFKIIDIVNKDDSHQAKIKVIDRVEIKTSSFKENAIIAEYELASDINDIDGKNKEDMLKYIKKTTEEIGENFKGAEAFVKIIEGMNDLNALIGYLTQYMQISSEEKYDLMKTQSVKERSLKFIDYLLKQRESIQLQFEMAERFNKKANKSYREAVLREQLKAIQEELSIGKDGSKKKDADYRERIKEARMPSEVEEVALEEATKLESQNPSSSEYNVIRNYLELLLKLPWNVDEQKDINVVRARKILNDDHYGLEKVKERILQYLAVMKLKKNKKGSILLLVGPPGTGKTSLGKSISEALNREYIRLSLGGVRDEAEIRGHRRTYVGAMPGRIIQGIKNAGVKNPVMILDEIDKLMTGYNGDPASALLEVLDPEQNSTFTDHYLDVPYDLSQVFFIATANSTQGIPAPLLDRMEVIQISSYTINEKFHIAKNHLIPSVIEEHGLTSKKLIIEDDALQAIISDYTMEAGVRGLKKQLATIARVATEKMVSSKKKTPFVVNEDQLEELLGRKVSRHDKAQDSNPAGVVTGLAWTPVGGEILFIEATDMPGNGQVILTGKLGDVMKESARISLSLLKSRFAVNTFKEKDLHIHVPSGAVPKDGPSAGITLFTALASLVTGVRVNPKLAMTGEITLRGAVLPIGGLKEKLIGAQRAGIKKVLIPKDNVVDLKDVPEEIKEELEIIAVETIEEVIKEALGISLPSVQRVLNPELSLEGHFGISEV
ncbi:endopeptidase La [Clostridium sp. 'White wine YQ']|uniref:endopeptidase La n=1 Tax=Clostridium sp. 'White wine YQ' TaxID=3027474 RepID=UPI0023666CEC|nr:endopeptidase La [Clostridium sp. 'White wine YQ']MDD7795462.1 endopeptidase La [Clostridium sp. 'White wine YQ']